MTDERVFQPAPKEGRRRVKDYAIRRVVALAEHQAAAAGGEVHAYTCGKRNPETHPVRHGDWGVLLPAISPNGVQVLLVCADCDYSQAASAEAVAVAPPRPATEPAGAITEESLEGLLWGIRSRKAGYSDAEKTQMVQDIIAHDRALRADRDRYRGLYERAARLLEEADRGE